MNIKVKKEIFLIVLLSIVLRLILIVFGNHPDLISNASWGQYLYINGMKFFYPNYKWIFEPPTQLPMINIIYFIKYVIFGKLLYFLTVASTFLSKNNFAPYIIKYYFDFLNWFGWSYFRDTNIPNGLLVTMKLIPITADVLIAGFIVHIGKLVNNLKFSIIVASLYLFLPLSWYLSALWGQYDQVAALLYILSFFFLYRSKELKSGLKTMLIAIAVNMFMFSFQIKPTIIYATPLFLLVFVYIKPKIFDIVIAFTSAILTNYWSVMLFTTSDRTILHYLRGEILPRVFFKARFLFSNQALNFWQLIGTVINVDKLIHVSPSMLFAVISGLIFVISAFVFVANKRDERLWSALYIVSTGNFLFNIGMMNRYFFTGILTMTILLIYKRKILLNWFVAIAIFSLNLYFSWGYPFNVGIWNYIWINKLMVFILSFINIVNFLLVIKKLEVINDVKFGYTIIKKYVGIR